MTDGGRVAAGFSDKPAGDCVVRAICIATGQDYEATFTDIFALLGKTPSKGVSPRIYEPYLQERGWKFVYAGRHPLTQENLPTHAKLIVCLSEHCAAVLDGVIHDTYDCSSGGRRQFYGYFYKEDPREVRARIARRIRALLQVTVANGATDAEAELAVARANEQMAKYSLTYKDIEEVRVDEYAEAETPIGTRNRRGAVVSHPVRGCLHSISRFACVRHWFRGERVVFYGTKIDTDVAIGLVALYGQQITRDLAAYQRSPEGRTSRETPQARRANYISYWTGSRNRRLDELTTQRKAPPPRTSPATAAGQLAAPEAEQAKGRELMIVREQVLNEKYESHTANWKWSRARSTRRRCATSDPRTREAARSAEAKGDLGVNPKLK